MGEDYELRGPEAVTALRLIPKEPKTDDKKEVGFSSTILLKSLGFLFGLSISFVELFW